MNPEIKKEAPEYIDPKPEPVIDTGKAKVFHGSNLDILPLLETNSIDAIVTDPPYELGFMGKKWDSSGIAYSIELWSECLRVLKPGGHLLAFSGSRTYHRMTVAIEDAGFEIRDMIAWISNKTFPKSHNIGKATAKEEWAGWGTALKPTVEPVVMARKPFDGTIAANVLEWGTGGLNIDGSRIEALDQETLEKNWDRVQSIAAEQGRNSMNGGLKAIDLSDRKAQGRWPANIILDEYTAGLLDEQSGMSKSFVSERGNINIGNMAGYGDTKGQVIDGTSTKRGHDDSGGASRFFYVAKASKKDRNEGLDDLPKKQVEFGGHGNNESDGMTQQLIHAPRANFHPTVKPTALMEYLIKLVTPPNGIVLDPFTGSGSTGKAALLNGYQFIGIELTEEYLPIIEGRLTHAMQTYEQQAIAEKEKESETLF